MGHQWRCPRSGSGAHYLRQQGDDPFRLRCIYCGMQECRRPYDEGRQQLTSHWLFRRMPVGGRYPRRLSGEVLEEW